MDEGQDTTPSTVDEPAGDPSPAGTPVPGASAEVAPSGGAPRGGADWLTVALVVVILLNFVLFFYNRQDAGGEGHPEPGHPAPPAGHVEPGGPGGPPQHGDPEVDHGIGPEELYAEIPFLRDFVDFRFDNPRVPLTLLHLDRAEGDVQLTPRQRERFLAELNAHMQGKERLDLATERLNEVLDERQREYLRSRVQAPPAEVRAPVSAVALEQTLERLRTLAGDATPSEVPEMGAGDPFYDLDQALAGLATLQGQGGDLALRPEQAAAALVVLAPVEEHELYNTPPLRHVQDVWVRDNLEALDIPTLLRKEGHADEAAAAKALQPRLRDALRTSLGMSSGGPDEAPTPGPGAASGD